MNVLAFDTATPHTVVGLSGSAAPVERRHEPDPGERPGHAQQVLALAREALVEAGLSWEDLDRIGVGTGPGTFTGLRIGVATARALAQSTGAQLVGVSTLEALARPALDEHGGPVLAVLDARRGEAFVAAWGDGGLLAGPLAARPEALAEHKTLDRGRWLAVGDGAIRFRAELESADIAVPADDSPLHRVGAPALCRLARQAPIAGHEELTPQYVRAPDAQPRRS